jgi:hypothetical protein
MPIKSFRGMMTDGGIDTVVLHTNDGSTGYRMTKLQVMPNQPFNKTQETVLKVYKVPQTTANGVVDFSDQTLLAAAIFKQHDTANYMAFESVIFDNEIFNQDIYITCYDAATGESVNYYFELEQLKLDLTENTVATLKDIRNIEAQYV